MGLVIISLLTQLQHVLCGISYILSLQRSFMACVSWFFAMSLTTFPLYLLLKFLGFFFTQSLNTTSDIKSACSCSFYVCIPVLHWSAAISSVLPVCRSASLLLKPLLASNLSLSLSCADELSVSFAKNYSSPY